MPYIAPGLFVPAPYKAPTKPKGVYTKGSIRTPRVTKPRGIYTKGSIRSSGARVNYPSRREYSIAAVNRAKPKPASAKINYPKLKVPSYSSGSTKGYAGGGISLPGTGASGSAIASIYRRTEAQLRSMAREAVMMETRPQVRAIDVGRGQQQKNYDYFINTLRKQLGLSKGDIKGLYDSLDVSLAVNAKKQAEINTQTKASMGQIYDQLTSQLGANYSKAQGTASAELQRMGIQNPQANDRMTADQQFLQGVSQTSKANSQSLLDAIGASTQGLMTGLRGSGGMTSNLLQGQLQQQFDKESADALQKHLAKMAQLKEQRNAIIASEPSKINQTYAALLDQQYQREMDAAQKLFDNQIKLGNFQLSQQSAQSTAAHRQNTLALAAQRLTLDQKKKAAAKPALKGMDKALNYLQAYSKKTRIPYRTLEGLLIDAINGDPSRTGDNAYPGFEAGRMSSYANDIRHGVISRGLPQSTITDMIRAMNYWFGKA